MRAHALAVVAAVALAGCLSASAPPPAGQAADGGPRPLMVVHGIQLGPGAGTDYGRWQATVDAWAAWGHAPEVVRWAYYAGDEGEDDDLGAHPASLPDHGHGRHFGTPEGHEGDDHTNEAAWQHLAYHWAWGVHDRYGAACVDVHGHSAGGVVVRYAVAAYAKRAEPEYAEFPPSLCVRRAVTTGSPHAGTAGAALCAEAVVPCPEQARSLQPGSAFQRTLASDEVFLHPDAQGGTSWLAIGSDADEIMTPPETAVAFDADVAVMHEARDRVTHANRTSAPVLDGAACWYLCRLDEEGTAHVRYRDRGSETWEADAEAPWPARRMFEFYVEPSPAG